MNAGEILAQHDFIKVAISDELKTKAYIERTARKAHVNWHSADPGPATPSKVKHFRSLLKVKGPDPKIDVRHSRGVINKLEKRFDQIDDNPTWSTATKLHNPADSLESHIKKVKLKRNIAVAAKNVGKGALIGAGVAGAAYGGKKLYDHFKTASLAIPALENLGLGILAAPSVAGLAGHPMGEKTKEIAEVGGLGVLAAHPTYELGHAAVNTVKGLPGQGNGLVQRAGQGIGNVVNKLRGAAPVLSKLAYNSFYQEVTLQKNAIDMKGLANAARRIPGVLKTKAPFREIGDTGIAVGGGVAIPHKKQILDRTKSLYKENPYLNDLMSDARRSTPDLPEKMYGKIILPRSGPANTLRDSGIINTPKTQSGDRGINNTVKLHESFERGIKPHETAEFGGSHLSPKVLLNEHNLLSSLSGPGSEETRSALNQMRTNPALGNDSQLVKDKLNQYYGNRFPDFQFGNGQKIPKAMKKNFISKFRNETNTDLVNTIQNNMNQTAEFEKLFS